MKFEKVNNGKGLWILAGDNYGYRNIHLTLNGQVWMFNLEIGRIFSCTFWEKKNW
jgi:hypothetical protein